MVNVSCVDELEGSAQVASLIFIDIVIAYDANDYKYI